MTKIYKINGKEIERINGGVIDFNGFKAENLTSTEMKINELLEALNGITINNPLGEKDIISEKQEEIISDKEVTNSQDSYQEEGRCKLKQKECENDCVQRYPSSKDWCDKHKQSTSLKEVPLRDKIDFIQDRLLNDHVTAEESITEILKLIQSHLVKEIDRNFNYTVHCTKEDIIKIINNITK